MNYPNGGDEVRLGDVVSVPTSIGEQVVKSMGVQGVAGEFLAFESGLEVWLTLCTLIRRADKPDGNPQLGYCECRKCHRRGYGIDEFTSPQTGLCAECSKPEAVQTEVVPCPEHYSAVNHPPHYGPRHECIEAIRMALTPQEFAGYLRGTMLAYEWRADAKGQPEQDRGKAGVYRKWLLEEMEAKQ